jgi:hypothetical protein
MRTLIAIAFSIAALSLVAQSPALVSKLDKEEILIGQQVHLDLSLTYRVGDSPSPSIVWPAIKDTLNSHIEVVEDSGVDTILPNKESDPYLFKQTRTLTLTSWDSGYWALPPLFFVINGDSIATDAMAITVNSVAVDTTAAIKDIKEIYEVPWGWMDWLREHWPWVAGGAVALAVLITVILFVVKRMRRPKEVEAAPEPEKPLHVRALLALEEVDKKKLWQQGLVKQHHSEVTDILRGYIEERFGVPALESTTDELLGALRMSSMRDEQREQLANLLRLADMVKFAKWTPVPAENEQLVAGVIKLVQQTTPTAEHVHTA